MDNKEFREYLIKRASEFSLSIMNLTRNLDNNISNKEITKQLIRSSTSIGANIVEAQAGSSRKDFANFINYALKSANETIYWLELLKGSTKDSVSIYSSLNEVTQIAKILGSSVSKLRNKI